ncbi:hypothetical protein PH586_14275 [Pseudomonas sp. SA3-5]|uniref:Uncharacterized protein n=1 Tax=Pseudomonas aestuarii TaxID=3018340 RepID=A0ABT4XHA1_9PSED|nr:hypothetical protein [Pseudomonas aestuarii]MDA7087552.1 hypothetical protein [Pseudomonas aestuarii]
MPAQSLALSPALLRAHPCCRWHEPAPWPLYLGTLPEVCSKKLGIGAQESLGIAPALY